ncbi:hypothetical protein H310_01533 [Aphanomyces invadans]|uniref:N-acetyltransferase domain-containing protein n=1 Tax=Aphanomyces invadans TaxID=157072 RepID=A0A024UTU2_9STRA|nr:hypothetical protein H310_01533 [Aphanomyces invadans]ETW09073.1 hypothetical protein H310_01533 [Aphanomyces invadans]|eukprot:XP_008862878.1 hypothetical protein H310_01533 [Aphanomyces invadans]
MFIQEIDNAADFAALTSSLLEADPFGILLTLDDYFAAKHVPTQCYVGTISTRSYAVVSPKRVAISRLMSTLEAESLGKSLSRVASLATLSRIQGPLAASLAFARGYCQHRPNIEFRPTATMLMYYLDTSPRVPQHVRGTLRAANALLDYELLVEWCTHALDSLGESSVNIQEHVTRGLEHKTLFLWDINGYPVGFIDHTLPTQVGGGHRFVIKVRLVYIVSSAQRHGYGTAMLASLCHHLQDSIKASSCRVVVNVDQECLAANKAIRNAGFALHDHVTITADRVKSTTP